MKKIENTHSYYCLRQTRFGSVAVVWLVHQEIPKILRVVLSKPGRTAEQLVSTTFPDLVSSSGTDVDTIVDQILAFLAGDIIHFSLDLIHIDLCTRFQQRVLRAEHGIPRGSVSTYKQISIHLGDANAARAVGNALATNPFPIIIPCHRAVRSDGKLGGYQGGLEMKRALLEMEGILFSASGRVVTEEFFY